MTTLLEKLQASLEQAKQETPTAATYANALDGSGNLVEVYIGEDGKQTINVMRANQVPENLKNDLIARGLTA